MIRPLIFGAVLGTAPFLFADVFFTYTGTPLVEGPEYIITTTNAFAVPGERLRVANWNIETFDDGIGDNPERTPDVIQNHARMAAQMLDKIDADVVVLQEIENGKMLQLLNDTLARPYPVGYLTKYGANGPDEVKLNDGLLSRFPVEDPAEIDFGPLVGPGRPARGLIRFIVNLGDGHKLLVYNVHLKSNFGSKPRNIAQRQAALNLLRGDADTVTRTEPDVKWEIIVTGDTNMDPDSAQFTGDDSFAPLSDWLDLFRQVPAADRVTMATRHGDPSIEFPPATFDRFFVSPEMTNAPWTVSLPRSVQEGCDTNDVRALPGTGAHVSDHYPVYLDVTK